MVGPHYKRPSAAAPPGFKEQPPVNYKEAEAAGWKHRSLATRIRKADGGIV